MVWPDFKFGSPSFNELTFDHWIVVAAELVPIDRTCVAGPFVWEVRLNGSFDYAVTLTVPLAWQIRVAADLDCGC